jgi:fucose permease
MKKKRRLFHGAVSHAWFLIGRFAGTWFMKFIAPAKLLALYSLI